MISIVGIEDLEIESYDEVWFIVRSTKTINRKILRNEKVKVVSDLAPSEKLFYEYLNWRKKGCWGQKCFDELYTPEFLKEIRGNEKSVMLLNQLVSIADKKNIALVCFCDNCKTCHRSIIGKMLLTKTNFVTIK